MINKQYSKTKPVCKVTFTITTEQVGKNAEVRVLGTFNEWSWDKGLVLTNKKKSYEGSLELAAGATYEYRYMVNGHSWVNDEAADDYHATPFFSHNCVLALDAVEVAAAPKAAAPKAAAPKAAAPKATAPKKAAGPKASDLKK
jgi:1,4-alpha-glucan branching enzyme